MSKKIRLAIADDSPFVRKTIARLFSEFDHIQLTGAAATGEELLSQWHLWNPDIVLLDLAMPGMGGLETLKKITAMSSTPVIIFSTHSAKDAAVTLEALDLGAADFIDKQEFSLWDFEALRSVLLEKLEQISRRRPLDFLDEEPQQTKTQKPSSKKGIDLIVIGASTGGPPAIRTILQEVDPTIPVPIIIVQHMAQAFIEPFALRLNSHAAIQVSLAADGDILSPGQAYLAPGDFHLRVKREKEHFVSNLSPDPSDLTHRPSVDILFESAVQASGENTLAILLTGMGKDGALGMKSLKSAGAYNLIQDEKSCVVFGMPGTAKKLGVVDEILPIERIGTRIQEIIHKKSRRKSSA